VDQRIFGSGLVIVSVTVLSFAQFVIKGRLNVHGEIPFSVRPLLDYLVTAIADWQLWLGLLALVLAALCWYAAISRIPLSIAYPIGALAYPLVFIVSILLLREPFTWTGLAGNILIVAGVALAAGLRV
jgi:drug/metabolite transporter (DMT)-like permease